MKKQTEDKRPVLVSVDFSKDSEAALLWACEYARFFKVKVIFLHVIHDPADAPGYYKTEEKDLLHPMEIVAKKMLDEFLTRIFSENPEIASCNKIETLLVSGLPPTRILEVAKKEDARIIVMGSRGRTALASFLLGSKTQRVLQLSPVPVTIIKAEKSDKEEK